MIRNVLSHIGGIELYGVISVLLFFTFFIGMLVWAFRLKTGHLESMGKLPLDDAGSTSNPSSQDHSPNPNHGSHPRSRNERE